jgi:lipoate-protein ligase A
MDFEPARTAAVLLGSGERVEDRIRDMERAVTSLRCHIEEVIRPHELAGILLAGFEEQFRVRILPGELTTEEARSKKHLLETKYRLEKWNIEGRAPR